MVPLKGDDRGCFNLIKLLLHRLFLQSLGDFVGYPVSDFSSLLLGHTAVVLFVMGIFYNGSDILKVLFMCIMSLLI